MKKKEKKIEKKNFKTIKKKKYKNKQLDLNSI